LPSPPTFCGAASPQPPLEDDGDDRHQGAEDDALDRSEEPAHTRIVAFSRLV
jgi:hypothetical protein